MESSNRTAQDAGIFFDGGRAHKIQSGLALRAMEDEMVTYMYNCWDLAWNFLFCKQIIYTCRNGHNLPQLVQDSEKPVVFYNWSAYYDEFSKK